MPPITVMIKPVSGACNMRCRYCFYLDELTHRQNGINSPMSLKTLETVIRRVLRAADTSASFMFQGGEPTLAGLDFFRNAVRFEKMYNSRGIAVSNAVQSNGLDISDEMISFFAENDFLLGISIDGTQALHDRLRTDRFGNGTYERILNTVSRLKRAGVQFNVLCVVNEAVAREPENVFKSLREFGFIQFIPCLDPLDGNNPEHSLSKPSYLDFLKKTFDLYEKSFFTGKPVSVRNFDNWIGLMLGRNAENCAMTGYCSMSLMIESNGDMYPCDFYGTDEWLLGNVNEVPFLSVLKSEKEQDFISESLPVPEKCRACKWYPLCRNGCKRERGKDGINKWCDAHSDFFTYAYPRMEKIARTIMTSR